MGEEVVIKLGGGAGPDAVLDDVAHLRAAGTPVVLVHGGGRDIDRLAAQLGTPARHVESASGVRSRHTDSAALETLTMSLLGRVKPALVTGLRRRGVLAAGLSGADAGIVTAQRKQAIRVRDGNRIRVVRDDLSGTVTGVAAAPLTALLAAGLVPVLSPPASSPAGQLLNVDADRVAAAIAIALGARALLLLSDVPGVLTDPERGTGLIGELDAAAAADLPGVRGRMRHKVRAAAEASGGGVPHVVIGSALGDRPVRDALDGRGTVVTGGRVRA